MPAKKPSDWKITTTDNVNYTAVNLVDGYSVSGTMATINATISTYEHVDSGVASRQSSEGSTTNEKPSITGGVVRTTRAPSTLTNGKAARTSFNSEGAMIGATGAPVYVNEAANSSRVSSGNSGAISTPCGGTLSGIIKVSSVTGTSPTLDITLEESNDNGVNFTQIWAAPRITGNVNIPLPNIQITGIRRWVWNIGGTSPNFTFSIDTTTFDGYAPPSANMFDRTIDPNTLGSASSVLYICGCSMLTLAVVGGAGATTAPVYGVQVSEDNAAWFDAGLSLSVGANANVMGRITAILSKYARIYVKTAGVGATQQYASLRALG